MLANEFSNFVWEGGMMNEAYESLSDRKRQILISSVEDYIRSALPITSNGVQQSICNDISTATLRSELNALEAMGYLKQLHTSSGRIPTSKAYRLYVDKIMHELTFKNNELDLVKENFTNKANNLGLLLENIAKTISKVTNYPTVVIMEDLKKLIINDIKIIPLIDYSAHMLLSTTGGVISNTFEISGDITNEDCINCARLLSQEFTNKSLADLIQDSDGIMKKQATSIERYKQIFDSVIELLKNIAMPVHKGDTKLLNLPEYNSVEKAKAMLEILEDEEFLKKVISNQGENMSFTIGRENNEESLQNCAVVKAPVKIGDISVANIGVIGPERIDYALVAGAINFVTNELKNIKQIETKGENDVKK